jgi:hypothetical protein
VDVGAKRVTCTALPTARNGSYFAPKSRTTISDPFEVVVIASGFGRETSHAMYRTPIYWRNDPYGQPLVDGDQQPFLTSGFCDGALCPLTIKRFRHDTARSAHLKSNPCDDLREADNRTAVMFTTSLLVACDSWPTAMKTSCFSTISLLVLTKFGAKHVFATYVLGPC